MEVENKRDTKLKCKVWFMYVPSPKSLAIGHSTFSQQTNQA